MHSLLILALSLCAPLWAECTDKTTGALTPLEAWLDSGRGISYAARMEFKMAREANRLPVILPTAEALNTQELEALLQDSVGIVWKMSGDWRQNPEGKSFLRPPVSVASAEQVPYAHWMTGGEIYFEVLFAIPKAPLRRPYPPGMSAFEKISGLRPLEEILAKPRFAIETLFRPLPAPTALLVWGSGGAEQVGRTFAMLDGRMGGQTFITEIQKLWPRPPRP